MAGKPPENEPPATTAPTTDELCRVVAGWVLALRPDATGCRIRVDHPDGYGGVITDTFTVPLAPASPDDLPTRILAVLGKLVPGQWIGGKALAAEVDAESHESGNFRRAVRQLREVGKLESNNNLGYRLAKS